MPIKVGRPVRKKDGYMYVGIAVAVYEDLYGVEHVDVQVPGEKGKVPFAGMIHVFPTRLVEEAPLENNWEPID